MAFIRLILASTLVAASLALYAAPNYKSIVVPSTEYGLGRRVLKVPAKTFIDIEGLIDLVTEVDSEEEVVPVKPSVEYGVPVVPSKPSSEYGVPVVPVKPAIEYGVPKFTKIVVPSGKYGVPKFTVTKVPLEYGLPSLEYGVPKKPFIVYGLPN